MIIDGKQKKTFKVIELLITSIGWIYILGFLVQITFSIFLWKLNITHIINELFIYRNLADTARIAIITISAALISFFVMYLWRNYNLKRFGSLRRRRFPKDIDIDVLSQYFDLKADEIIRLQSDKWIELDETIV
ncbi:MAG: poly-beta-1,6-N-acetyl-D-glucosamine biosynthesis protein PgaD [Bacillota bacterium]|nr:poly-beta-1,6-N-acetyl-D-glucosamine biosynthesis protein PgaD [Bacillota bacterium]